MKKFSKVLSVLLALTLVAGLAAVAVSAEGYLETTHEALPGVAEGWTRYEAEDAVIIGSSKQVGQENVTKDGCENQDFFSGGQAAGGFADQTEDVVLVEDIDFAAENIAHVKFTVTAAAAGETTMTIAFNGGNNGCGFVVQVNDGEKQLVACPEAPNDAWDRMGTADCTVTLNAGENTVYVSRPVDVLQLAPTTCWRNIDFIDVKDIEGADDTTTTTEPTTTTTIPEGALVIEVGTVVGAVGDKVVVPVTIPENSGVNNFTGVVTYDPAQLKPVEADYDGETLLVGTEVFKAGVEANIASEGNLKVSAAKSGAGYTKGGALLLVTFEVLEGYTGNAEVSVEFTAFQVSGEDGDVDAELYPIAGGVVAELPTVPSDPVTDPSDPVTTPSDDDDTTTTGPVTGEGSDITLYLLLAGAAVVVMAGSVVALKKAQAK